MLCFAVLSYLDPEFSHVVYQLLKCICYLAFEVFKVDENAKLFSLKAT